MKKNKMVKLACIKSDNQISAFDDNLSSDNSGLCNNYTKPSEFSNCLPPLLQALGWIGHKRHVAEALPHFSASLDITGLRNVMVALNFSSKVLHISLDKLDKRLLPCLFVPKKDPALVIIEEKDAQFIVFNGITCAQETIKKDNFKGTAYLFSKIEQKPSNDKNYKSWFWNIVDRFRPLMYEVLLVSLFLNVFILAIPIFIMVVYDSVIGSGSTDMLIAFAIGVFLALLGSLLLSSVRTKNIAYIAARLDHIIGKAIFEQLLYLSPAYTENSPLGAQVARIKDFDTVRDFFAGPMFTMLFDLPFVLLFIFVIWCISGPLAYIPIAMIFVFVLITLILRPYMKESVAKMGRSVSMRQSFQLEALNQLSTIKYSGAESIWIKRFQDISSTATYAGFKTSLLTSVTDALSTTLMTLSGLFVLGFGVLLIFNNEISMGALIATMMLIWRVLSPVKRFFSSISQFSQLQTSIGQINRLMNIAPEHDPNKLIYPIKRLQGRVTFNRVSFRYRSNLPPSLIGVSFTVQPREVVCIIGRNGSGKSTLLKLISNIYTPQAGGILLDERDIRQCDPIESRHAISYLPQVLHFFYGTIEQNLRLFNPIATQAQIIEATQRAGIFEEIMNFPDKFQTRFSEKDAGIFTMAFKQCLALARTYIKCSGLILFDEPENSLSVGDDKRFI